MADVYDELPPLPPMSHGVGYALEGAQFDEVVEGGDEDDDEEQQEGVTISKDMILKGVSTPPHFFAASVLHFERRRLAPAVTSTH